MTRKNCCRKARTCKEVKTKALKEKALEFYLSDMSQKEVAEQLGLRRETVNVWLKEHGPEVEEAKNNRQREMNGKINELRNKGMGYGSIAKEINLTKSAVQYLVNGMKQPD
jgi:orotate phosphoribosyltransferase-like protein